MSYSNKYVLILGVLLFSFQYLVAQETEEAPNYDDKVLHESFLTIRNVITTGNKITKPYIIAREVPLKKGTKYSISDILKNIPQAKSNLLNTGLFIDVAVDFTNWINDSLDILVDVKERWYYFPVPYLKPVDRNFNVWIKEYGASLSRVNYGVKLIGYNVSGRNDKLNIWLISGYSRQVVLNYTAPYFDKSLKNGISLDFLYSANKELNYASVDNKQAFYKNPNEFITSRFRAGIGYSYRTGYIKRHVARISYNVVKINDSLRDKNPDYFGNGQKTAKFPELFYQYQSISVDYIPYPLKGSQWEFAFMKRGINKDMNLWEFNVKGGRYLEIFPKYYFSLQGNAILKLPFTQPYFNQELLGYRDVFLRGLENYVVEGAIMGLAKTTIRREIWSPKLRTGLKSRNYGTIPFRFFLKAYGDAGYVYNKMPAPSNTLANRLLYTGGAGLDIWSIYDATISLEYSFNQLGQRGLFFQAGLGL
ncbi:MAG: POTRA domain-containing protein [Agriterribacter sp.]